MKPSSRMLLNDELPAKALASLRLGLWRAAEVALSLEFIKRVSERVSARR